MADLDFQSRNTYCPARPPPPPHLISQALLNVLHLQSYFKAGLLMVHGLRKGTELADVGHTSLKAACDTGISL